jgi:hypothetical protein
MSCSVTEDLGPAVFTEAWGFALSPLPSATPGSCIAAALRELSASSRRGQ